MMKRIALAGIFCTALSWAQAPPLAGIAHVAFRVSDLEASRAFYNKLGFEQFFVMERDGKAYEAFLKVNDHQFIELYPRTADAQPLGLMHVCYEADDLEAVRAAYAARGLNPPAVRKAGAGNLLLVIRDPEGEVIEYTQYMPGSRHYEDRGKHLGAERVSDRMQAAAFPVKDVAAVREFYIGKLGFEAEAGGAPGRLRIPGKSGEWIGLQSAAENAKPTITFVVNDPGAAAAQLKELGFTPKTAAHVVFVPDPDGAAIEFTKVP
jgi:catechol 2,3-dioxygenase-like lactoylglutathione lyase family enzyme